MKTIAEIDPNFKLSSDIPTDTVFCDPREEPFRRYGLVPNAAGSYCRLPLEMLPQCSEGVRHLAFHLAGACVRFSTDSEYLAVLWELGESGNMAHFTPCGQSGMELFEETDRGTVSVKNLLPQMRPEGGCLLHQSALAPLQRGLRHYALYLPLYNSLRSLTLGFAPGARIETGRVPAIEEPLVFYGSSITQGGCASRPGTSYQAIISRMLDCDFLNLGFSGSARGEESIADYMASLEMSAFVCDYDHNAPSVQHLAGTHERLYRKIRAKHPDLPILLISKPDILWKEDDADARRAVIRATYEKALSEGDRNVAFLDGARFFAGPMADDYTVDGSHPTDAGFMRMAQMIGEELQKRL